MTLKTKPIFRMFSLFLLLLLTFSILPVQSLAAEDMYEGEIELTGKFNGTFTLDSSTMELFNLENVVPGDTWKGKLHVKNAGGAKMEIAIISIVSNLEDLTLYDALDLKISLGSEEIYNGSYGATQEPISKFYEIPAQEKITFDLVVSLPKTAGNNIQNKEMDSTWTFEGRYYGSSGGVSRTVNYTVYYVDEDGNELLDSKIGRGRTGSTVTEKAPTIKGYTPDAEKKSLVLKKKDNEIIFVYRLDSTEPVEPNDPTDPSEPTEPTPPSEENPPSEEPTNPNKPGTPDDEPATTEPTKDPSVKTGVDMTDSNSMVAFWLFIFILCLVGGFVLFFRIRGEKKRIANQNSRARRLK